MKDLVLDEVVQYITGASNMYTHLKKTCVFMVQEDYSEYNVRAPFTLQKCVIY